MSNIKINIVKPILPSLKKINKKISECLKSGIVTNNGQNVKKFEKNLQFYFKSKFEPVAFCNGQLAFYALLQAWKHKLKIKNFEKVYALVPSFTWSGTVNSLILSNIEPIFCDVDETFTIDIDTINLKSRKFHKIKKKIKFLIPVSNYGNIPDLDKIKIFSKKNNLIPLIDSAAAFGSKYKNKFPINYGFDEIYSFHATKIMTSMEGGCVISNDKKIINFVKYFRDFGQFEKKIGNIKLPGLNAKMQEISAIVGNYNLKNFKINFQNRLKVIKKYRRFFKNYSKKNILKEMKVNRNSICNYLYYPVVVMKKNKILKKELVKSKISFRKYYTAVHTLEFYKKNKKFKFTCLNFTNSIKDKIIALPLFSNMTNEELNHLFKTFKKIYNN